MNPDKPFVFIPDIPAQMEEVIEVGRMSAEITSEATLVEIPVSDALKMGISEDVVEKIKKTRKKINPPSTSTDK